jgi:AAA+ ATPase superfamily predicted ATPase
LYGRRRVGKTSLIQEFVKGKPFIYFLASEESELQNIRELKGQIAEFTGDELLAQSNVDNWDILFKTLVNNDSDLKLVLALDEFQYLGKTNPAFPSIFQRIWDKFLIAKNIMVILCGSLTHMMEAQTLNYNSPLYGRRTGQIKLKQIEFQYYKEFFEGLPYRELIEHYAVTGGVPKYIEMFEGKFDLFSKIERNVLNKQGFLFEEPLFLLQNEVSEVGSYFSIIKSIAAGNRRLSKICADLEVKQTNMPKYLKTLIDLDILEREVPITEDHPEKSKMGLYQIKDNYLRFWFRFIYPEKARLELGDRDYVMKKLRQNFIDNHVAFIYEDICRSEMWRLAKEGQINFNKLGKWWNKKEEIDIVAFDSMGDEIVFGECKYRTQPMDIDVLEMLLAKKNQVAWKKDSRREHFVLFSISGFTERLHDLATKRGDLILFSCNPK